MSFPRASTEPGSAWGPQNKTQSWVHLQVGARENIRLDTFSCAWGKKKKKTNQIGLTKEDLHYLAWKEVQKQVGNWHGVTSGSGTITGFVLWPVLLVAT